MEWHQRLVLLPGLHLPAVPRLLSEHVSHPRLSGFYSVCCVLVATILLHRQDWAPMVGYGLVSRLRSMYGYHRRMPGHKQLC